MIYSVFVRAIAAALCAAALGATHTRAYQSAARPSVPKTSDEAVLERARRLKKPALPPDARRAGVAGTVAVRVIVSPDGEVVSARAVAGPDALRAAAVAAAKDWVFASTLDAGPLYGFIVFRFTSGDRYAAILGTRDLDLAEAPVHKPEPATPKPAPKPAPAPPAPSMQRVADGVLISRATHRVAPEYPATARAARIEGVVVVELVVDETGRVAEARAIEGPALLRDTAVEAASKWAFKPGHIGKRPVKTIGTISFNFQM